MARACSCDPGTMFLQVAEKDKEGKIVTKCIRNAFIELDASEETEEALSRNDWQYVYDEKDKKYYVIGEDALKMAKMFPGQVEIRRPMQDGVLNKGENKKMMILNNMVEKALGISKYELDTVTTCVSSPSVDGSGDSSFHKARLQGMFKRLGWKVNVIEEGHAVILAENPKMEEEDGEISPFSGLGISLGAGRVNAVLAYKGKQILGMSCARSGDYIDKKVCEATDSPMSHVISKKEKKLDFNNLDYNDDVIFALDTYYEDMIKYVFSHFAKKFKEVQSEFPGSVEIVIAGGTSTPKGFIEKVSSVIQEMQLPFKIKEIRRAKDPRNCVAIGCLQHAIISKNRLKKKMEEEEEKRKEQELKEVQSETENSSSSYEDDLETLDDTI